MLTLAGWRKEEVRLNEVFKLQFQATQVSLPGVDALTLSLVPADIRKPTQRLQKAIIRDGTCEWEDPAYETIRFVREPQTGKINHKIYHFIVSSGLSKAGIIGEVAIDFADYAEATDPCTLSLPLNDFNPNTVLHVLIHRLHDITNEIEEEEIEDVKMNSQLMSLESHFSIDDTDHSVDDEDDPSSGSNINTLCGSCEHDSYPEIKKLKAELVAMARQADVTKLQLQDLSREVSLREAKNGLEAERSRLKAMQEHRNDENRDIWALVNEITQELDLEKDKNSNLRLQLHKTQESNAELVLAVQDLDKMLALKEGEVADLLSRKDNKNVDIDQKALEEDSDPHSLIKTYQREKEYLETRMEQEVHESSYKLQQTALQEHQCSLDARIESLEDDLSKQAREFETKIDMLVREIAEQEQRAIQAEETLRTAKWKDTNTAEKIQSEFRRLSAQMTSTFEANEKLATKAVEEAADLRMQKIQLEAKIIDLTNHTERMSLENDDKSNQLKLEGELNIRLSQEIVALTEERENLRVQLEKTDLLVQRGNVERSELASKIDSMEKELQRTIHIKQLLEIELRTLKQQCTCHCSDLTGFLFEDELARVIRTTGGMKADDNAVVGAERRVREHSGGLAVSVRTKTSPRRNKAQPVCSNLKEVEKMKEKIRSLQVEEETSEITLLTEMASLKERNKSIERQLKEMQERYSEISQFEEP